MEPLFGGHHTAVGLTQRVGTIADDTLRPDVDCIELLTLHRLYRIAIERLYTADLSSFHALLPPWSCHRLGIPFSSFCEQPYGGLGCAPWSRPSTAVPGERTVHARGAGPPQHRCSTWSAVRDVRATRVRPDRWR